MRAPLLLLALCVSCGDEPSCGAVSLNSPAGRSQICGNGDVEGTEQCDDGNVAAGDGCSAACAIESGFACVGHPSVCCGTMPAGAVMVFDSDHMASASNNIGLANGDQVKSWKDTGIISGAATAAAALNSRAAGAILTGAETNHDAFLIGNSIVQMDVAGTQAGLSFIPTTGIFDCYFAGRVATGGPATSNAVFSDSAVNNVLFYLNRVTGGSKMSVIMNGGAVLENGGPVVTVGARSVMEWSGDGVNIRMRLNNGTATSVAYAGATAPIGNYTIGNEQGGTYTSAMLLLRAAYCYNTELSAGNRSSAVSSLQCGMDAAARTVISAEGDSIVALGANGVNKSWPQDLQATLNTTYPRTWLVGNNGSGGDKITDVNTRIVAAVVGQANITKVVIAVGINDCVGQNGAHAAVVFGDTVTAGTYAFMIHQLKIDGSSTKQIYPTSITPFGNYVAWDQNAQDCADNLDALVRVDSEITGYIDTFVALRASSSGACAGAAGTPHTGACAMSTSFDGTGESGVTVDGLHPGIAGAARIATTVQTGIGL